MLEGVLTHEIEGKTYYALYFDKSNKGYPALYNTKREILTPLPCAEK